jgi:hypothetical protein
VKKRHLIEARTGLTVRFGEIFDQLHHRTSGNSDFVKFWPQDALKTDRHVPHQEAPDRNEAAWVFFLRDFFQASWPCFQRDSPYVRGYSSPLTVRFVTIVSKR